MCPFSPQRVEVQGYGSIMHQHWADPVFLISI